MEKYHTFALELLPHEARLLVDGAVMRRWPDRLIPDTDQRSDYMTYFPRAPMNFRIGEFDLGVVNGQILSSSKADFEGKYGINGTAYQWIDYVKVWNLPSDITAPPYPH